LDIVLPPLFGDERRKEMLKKEFRVSKNIAQETKSYDPSLVGRIRLSSAAAASETGSSESAIGSEQPSKRFKDDR
jgi:hypothetical protein